MRYAKLVLGELRSYFNLGGITLKYDTHRSKIKVTLIIPPEYAEELDITIREFLGKQGKDKISK